MNLKYIKIFNVFGVFLLSFLAHFMYSLFPCILISFFFPVNESIWEHMKILFTSTLLYGIIDYFLLKFYSIKFQNFAFQLFITCFFSVIIYLVLYLPVYYFFGENLFFSIFLMFLVYTGSSIISYKLLTSPENIYLNYIATPLIIMCYIMFIIFTYKPPHNFLFYDTLNNHYGIKNIYYRN